jgi:DNA polymerase (family X)
METREVKISTESTSPVLSNAQIADRLAGLAQLLSPNRENLYKVKAYRRGAAKIRSLSESLDELVRQDADLTTFPGIGDAIASAIREIVLTGTLRKLDTLRGQAAPEIATLADYPRLDLKRVLRIYKKLKISSIEGLREKLESGEIEAALGQRMAQHVRQGLSDAHAILLYHADDLRDAIEAFLSDKCGVAATQVAGVCRRRVEVVEEIAFVIQTEDFPAVVKKVERYGGRTPLLELTKDVARFALSAGIELRLRRADADDWGLCLVAETGSEAHIRKLEAVTGTLSAARGPFPTEAALYSAFQMA